MKIYIDLLPEEKKKEIKRKKIFRTILREEILFLFPVFVMIVILMNVFYLVKEQHNSLIAAQLMDKNQDKYQQLNFYEDKLSQANDQISKLLKIQKSHLYWSNLFYEFNSVVPDGLYITNISTRNYQILITGKARNRNDLLNFKSRLDNNSCFQNVNMPLSDLVVKENVDFQMDFTITQSCLNRTN